MLANFGTDFSTEVRYFYASAAITKGHFVKRCVATTLAVPDPVAENAPTRYIIPVQMCAPSITAHQEAVIGVALRDISATTWGPICVGGPCGVRIAVSAVFSAGAPIGATSASIGAGVELGLGATNIAVPAWCLYAQTVTNSGVANAALLDCYIEPIRVSGAGGAYT